MAPATYTFWENVPIFVVFIGPPPEDDGIGANTETKDAPALIRFKRSGRLYVVSYVVSENVVDRSTELKYQSVHLSEIGKFQRTQRGLCGLRVGGDWQFESQSRVSTQARHIVLKLNNLLTVNVGCEGVGLHEVES